MPSQTDTAGPFGLLELAHGENANVDIVAVHGLDGHREASWTADNGVLWLRDLLPTRIPNARIFSYGYDVNTRSQYQLSTVSIHDHGINLITILALKRRWTSTEGRPIIFVAHSLGGIMLKSALIHASACGKDHLPDHKAVEVSTSGILFFGTPHQGSATAGLATLMLNVLSAFRKGTSEIAKDFQSHSRMLQQQLTQYQAISSRFNTKFYVESYETPIGPIRKLLVPRYSAVVPGAVNTEVVFLNKNHIDMVKFQSTADGDFSLVSLHLSIMAEEAEQRIVDRWEIQKRAEGAIPGVARTVPATARERDDWKSQKGVSPVKGINALAAHDSSDLNNEAVLRTELAPLPALPYQEAGESFVGRSQALDWIHEMFKKHRKLVLYGIGGIGKTGTAVEYVYTHRHDYDIIFWVNGDTSESTTSGFVGIAQQLVKWRSKDSAVTSSSFARNYLQTSYELGLDGFVDDRGKVSNKTEDRVDILNAVKEWLSQSKSGNWLLIFDNVDDLDSFHLATFFPTPLVGRILITSRNLGSRSLGTSFEVTALGEDDSVQLLVNKSQGGVADSAAREIVRMLEGLPLAIELVAAQIAALQLSYKSYLEYNEEPWKSVFTRSIKPYGKSLVTTLEVSYRAIAARCPAATDLLLICAFLNNEDIPEQLFRGKLSGATIDQALEQLFAFSLAKRSPTISSFSIHPLVHAWAREQLDGEQKTAAVTRMVILLNDAIFQAPVSLGHIYTCAKHALEHCLPKLDAKSDLSIFQSLGSIAELERGPLLQGMFLLALKATERAKGSDSVQAFEAMNLLSRAYLRDTNLQPGNFLRKALHHKKHVTQNFIFESIKRRLQGRPVRSVQQCVERGATCDVSKFRIPITGQGQWEEAKRFYQRSFEGLAKTLGLDHSKTLQAIDYMGLLLFRRGRFEEAVELLQRAIETRERTLGLDHPDTIESVHNVAVSLAKLGRFEEAEKMSRRAVEDSKRNLGLDHPNTIRSVHILAISWAKLGQFEEAEYMLRHALEGSERNLGLDHLDTIQIAHNLALSLAQLGRFEEAEKLGRRALEGSEKNLGLDHPDTIQIVHDLALSSKNLGRFEEAEKMDRRALEGREKTLGLDHPDTIESVHNLAVSLAKLGRFEESETVGRRALEGKEKNLGLDHPDTIRSVHNLAFSLGELGRFEEAEKMDRRALEGREKTLGLDHPDTISSVNNLAVSLAKLGRFEEAETVGRRALEGMERNLGLDHPDTIRSVHNLAASLGELGRLEEAEKMGRRALEGYERILGLIHPVTIESIHNLALSLAKLGRFEEAEKMRRHVLEVKERNLGLGHPDTIRSVHVLALSLVQLGRFEEAERMGRRALEGFERNLGLDHPDTIRSVHNLALSLAKLGRFEEAEKMGQRALENRERNLGLDHPDTIQSAHILALSLTELGRFGEAETMARRAHEGCEKSLGMNHPDTMFTAAHLVILLRKLGRLEEAETLTRHVMKRSSEEIP